MVGYAGPFAGEYRQSFEKLWLSTEDNEGITHKQGATLVSVLGQPVIIQQWAVCGLPNDNLSVENGIIIATARRWPLMIDPQRQANKYIKLYGKMASEQGMGTCKLSDPNLLQTVELGIQFGKWILLENIGEALDPALEPVLQQQKIRDGTSFVIKLGDKNVAYDDKFRFFMTTTLSNPHYSPETSVKATLLNFAITPEGLQDQMLGIVVAKEQPEMEEKKQELVKNGAAMNKQLKDIEDEILRLLSAEGDILESKELIDTLEYSKKTSAVINKAGRWELPVAIAMEEAKVTEVEIDEVRRSYKDYAFRSQLLFFAVSEMSITDPMYQFSLQWFQQLAGLSIDNAPAGETPLLFSFSLTMKIMDGEGRLDANEARFLMAGPTGEVKGGPPNPAEKWLTSKSWNEVLTLAQMPAFKGFDAFFASNVKGFQRIYDAPEADKEPIPGEWATKMSPFQKLCFLRTLRPDRIQTSVLDFVTHEMGQKFVEPPVFDIAISYEDSTKMSPLIFVLSAGSDPVADMLAFAEASGMGAKLESISLGQGQGPKAAKMIEKARESGGWVLLCNCHLSISWLPELERICEQMNPDDTDNNYRLWLTSMPTKQFPALLLQNGVKMTNEPPKGLRANVLGSMMKCDDRMLSDCEKPEAYARLVFGFCFFHAVCQDRRKFGPIGWNIPYNFTPEDLTTNRRQLKYFLDNFEEIPYTVLQFLGSRINYGGRVTDKKDKVLIDCLIKIFICEEVVVKGADYHFSASGIFHCPNASSQDEFLSYLRALPIMTPPEVFGLHENCEITCAELAAELEKQTPNPWDLDNWEDRFPTKYEESRNTVVKQEAAKYNKLLSLLKVQLPLFRRAVKGFVVMTDELEAIGKGLFMNTVPEGSATPVGFHKSPAITSTPNITWPIFRARVLRRDFRIIPSRAMTAMLSAIAQQICSFNPFQICSFNPFQQEGTAAPKLLGAPLNGGGQGVRRPHVPPLKLPLPLPASSSTETIPTGPTTDVQSRCTLNSEFDQWQQARHAAETGETMRDNDLRFLHGVLRSYLADKEIRKVKATCALNSQESQPTYSKSMDIISLDTDLVAEECGIETTCLFPSLGWHWDTIFCSGQVVDKHEVQVTRCAAKKCRF
ncbi:unnamed protein product [Cladocopium goreaui]|uniref:Dynein heavy chain 1, axonemal n=1 Tax=Cladocopium goreaui TaxID=2562237 RepID=A0A9P1BZC5_9DINO|nr:unnamed protein product [Cladocopium goreaui]